MGKIKLSFDGLPHFATSPFFCSLKPSTELALKNLPNAYERAVAALRFCQNIGGGKDALGVSEEHVRIMQVAYLRAALMEYVAIEEVLSIDLSMRDTGEEPLRIRNTGNAMLILLRELRHLQLHLLNTEFKSSSRFAFTRTRSKVYEFETEVAILTIPDADLLQLKTLRNAARFDEEELSKAIAWFSNAQSQWGIGDVMLSGIQTYADKIVQHYSLEVL